MARTGICTLANDKVLDQVIALINSIGEFMGPDFPVCIFPYDNNCSRLREAIAHRPNVQIFQDQAAIDYWDNEVRRVLDSCIEGKKQWSALTSEPYYRFGTYRRLGAFSGPFERFLYMDADTILLQDVTPIFERLDSFDWVVYDFQHKDVSHVYNAKSPKLFKIFTPEQIKTKIFCSGFFAAKRETFSQGQLDHCVEQLQAGENEIIYWASADQSVLNYWSLRSNLSLYNYALELPREQVTGCCVTSDHFQAHGQQLLDGDELLTYLHYIGLSATLFSRLCAGENLDFPYRDLFLHYRYLHEPAARPQFSGKARPYDHQSLTDRLVKKLHLPQQLLSR
jgi:hypothetical protein